MANTFSTAGTARTREVAADRAVLTRRVPWPAHSYVAEIRLSLLLQPLFLDNLAQIEITLEVPLLLSSLVDALLVFMLARLSFSHLEPLIVIQLCHLIGVFEEVLLQVSKLFLNDCSPLVLVYLPDGCCEALIASSVPSLGNGGRHESIYYYIDRDIYTCGCHLPSSY